MFPQGTIGPIGLPSGSPSPPGAPPGSPIAPPPPAPPPGANAGTGPAGCGPLPANLQAMYGVNPPRVKLSDLAQWGQSTPSLASPPRDPVSIAFVFGADDNYIPVGDSYILLVDTLGVGFPPICGITTPITEPWLQVQRDVAANTKYAPYYPLAGAPSPPPPPSPPVSPPVSPPLSPPLSPPPSPPLSPGCVHVCIDSWPTITYPPPPPPPPPPFSPPAQSWTAPLPPPPSRLPPPPAACKEWTIPLGFPRVGSEDYCRLADEVTQTIRAWGAMFLDKAIAVLDKMEAGAWDWYTVDTSSCDETVPLPGSLFDPSQWGKFGTTLVQNVLDCLGSSLKWLLGAIGYQIAHWSKAVLCMLRNAQTAPGYLDWTAYIEVWVVLYAWRSLKKVRLSSPDFLGLQTVGADTEDFFAQLCEFILKTLGQMRPPGHPEAIEAFLMGTVSEVQFRCWMQLSDISPEVWSPVIQSRREQLLTDERIDSIRRAALPDGFSWGALNIASAEDATREASWLDASVSSLRYVGWINPDEAAQRVALYDEIPTIADHLHWLARNIDDAEYVRDYHLLDGFDSPQVISGIFAEAGVPYQTLSGRRDFWKEFGSELRSQGMRKVDAMRHYAAHWLHPAPGQMREFVWRLRPDRTRSPEDELVAEYFAEQGYPPELVARATTFTADDFRRILNEQDYGYLDVAWFVSTLYHVPALSYLRDMYRYGTIDEEDLKGYHQDLGYTLRDSERFVDVDRKIKNRIRTAEAFAWTPSALSRSYGLGQIDRDFAQAEMTRQGFNGDEVDGMLSRAEKSQQARILMRSLSRVMSRTMGQVTSSYSAGVLDEDAARQALQGLGVPEQQATAILDMESLKVRTKLAQELVRTVRGAFLKGKVNEAQALQLLTEAQVTPNMVAASMATWKLEMMQTEKHLTAAEIRKATIDGRMTVAEARTRLTNLGYTDADMQILMEEVTAKAAEAQAKALTVHDRTTQREQDALAKAARAAEEAKQKAILALQRKEPVAKLQKWAQDGLITEAYFTQRMITYGYDPGEVALYWSEACARRGAHCNGEAPPTA